MSNLVTQELLKALVNVTATHSDLGTESFSDGKLAVSDETVDSIYSDLQNTGLELGGEALAGADDQNGCVDLSPEHLRAGVQMLAACSAEGVSKAATLYRTSEKVDHMGMGFESISSFDGIDSVEYDFPEITEESLGEVIGKEAFDNIAVSGQAQAVFQSTFAINAARQTPFAEMFFRTKVLSQTQGGFTLETKVISLYDNKSRALNGSSHGIDKVNIADANINPATLESSYLDLIPVRRATGEAATENVQYFIGVNNFDTSFVPAGSTGSVTTRPLVTGKPVNVLDLANTGVNGTVRNSKDSVAPNAEVASVAVSMAGPSGDEATLRYFQTKLMGSGARFNRAHNRTQDREMVLNYQNGAHWVDNTTTVGGTVPAEFAALADGIKVYYTLSFSGTLNLQSSQANLQGSISVVAIKDVTKTDATRDKDVTHADYADVVALLNGANVIGWTPKMKASNANLRFSGQFLDLDTPSEMHGINLSEPFYLSRPMAETSAADTVLKADAIVAALRTNNHHKAIATLEEAFSTLYAQVGDIEVLTPDLREQLPVFGRHNLNPYVQQVTIDLGKSVDSLDSKDREDNIRAAILDTISHYAQEAIVSSNIRHVASKVTGKTDPRIVVEFGCDEYLGRYLQRNGDPRTIGPNMVLRVQSTNQVNMRGKAYMTLSVEGTDAIDLLPGIHAFVPEMLVNIKPNNDVTGATDRAILGMTRNNHVWISPVLVQFNYTLEGIREAAITKTVQYHAAP